jgi:hypothetical protein
VALYLLLNSRFLVCDDVEAQRLAYLTNTPTLTINAADAFSVYPIRGDGLFLLKTAIDLDSGRVLGPAEMITEAYFRNLRNHGYRGNTAAAVLDAAIEMHEGTRHGWRESPAQAAFRARVAEAGGELAARFRHVAVWGPDRGFIGEGRLARRQADLAGGGDAPEAQAE